MAMCSNEVYNWKNLQKLFMFWYESIRRQNFIEAKCLKN